MKGTERAHCAREEKIFTLVLIFCSYNFVIEMNKNAIDLNLALATGAGPAVRGLTGWTCNRCPPRICAVGTYCRIWSAIGALGLRAPVSVQILQQVPTAHMRGGHLLQVRPIRLRPAGPPPMANHRFKLIRFSFNSMMELYLQKLRTRLKIFSSRALCARSVPFITSSRYCGDHPVIKPASLADLVPSYCLRLDALSLSYPEAFERSL
jgi:hypothetical protein